MSISYRGLTEETVNDGYSQVLREAAEYFEGERIQMMGSGFQEIISEQALFDTYVDKLTKGLNPNEAEQVSQLFENARTQIMSESSISGIEPIAALSMPTVRKMWAKVALKHAIPTQVVKKPKFVISYAQPYIMGPNGEKHDLPYALQNDLDSENPTERYLSTNEIMLDENDGNSKEINLLDEHVGDVGNMDSIDPEFYIKSVVLTDDATGNNDEVEVWAKIDMDDNIYVEAESSELGLSDSIFGNIDFETGFFRVSSLKGNVTQVNIRGKIESTTNRESDTISFDIKRKDCTIGTGAHINAPLPVEWLQDTMAMYNIDGATEVVDLMSNVVSLKLEQEIYKFLRDSFRSAGEPYKTSFDCLPPERYNRGPSSWRNELRVLIDNVANRMKKDTNFYQGKFVLVGSPVDTNILPNVDWTFSHVTDEKGGVNVEFDLGAFSGSNRYEIVSSNYVDDGKLFMFFVPESPKQMTYKYFPYTFTVEKGYKNPQESLVPNVMMTKRHTVEELRPIIAEIKILNNDGRMAGGSREAVGEFSGGSGLTDGSLPS